MHLDPKDLDIVTFTETGIWIEPFDLEPFRFSGSVREFLSILVYHTELDITTTHFLVHVPTERLEQCQK